ncbi:DUF559 domain-containing protein [Sinorhizobium sp. BJ1]|nr:DUF559 domain-containing protein [Sinorhizobium sp. BJ1]
MAEAELKLWNESRAHRLMGLCFRRRVPIAGYIDNVCKHIVRVIGKGAFE